jgi:endonuclease/exonuclease/phosphatase family metal-dependent hydrolase
VRLDLRSPPPQLESYLSANPHTASAAGSLPTVAQIVRLRSRCAAGRILVVANTHLYFANPAVHVRLMQARALLAEVESEVEACRDLCGANGGRSSEVGVVVAGDLNSDSTDAAVQLLLERRISSSHRDWRVGALHWPPALGLAAHAADTARRLGDSLRRLNLAGEAQMQRS